MSALTKTFPAEVKAAPDGDAGTFEALVAVFGNVDLVGDRVVPGAFTKSLAAWQASGDPIPVTWSHDWSIDGIIGEADPASARETDRGLVVSGRLDLSDPKGRKAFDLLKRRLVKNFSFSYEVPPGGAQRAKDGANELVELDLIELGPTMVGANRSTELLATKASPATDDSAWDGNAAMGACSSAADYRSICAGERDTGQPDERQHWALPHHYLGKAANAAGVANARARFAQTQGLTNRDAAKTHLFTTHTLPSDEGKSVDDLVAHAAAAPAVGSKAGRILSAANEARLREGVAAINDVLSQLAPPDEADDGKAEDPAAGKAEDQIEPESWRSSAVLQEAAALFADA